MITIDYNETRYFIVVFNMIEKYIHKINTSKYIHLFFLTWPDFHVMIKICLSFKDFFQYFNYQFQIHNKSTIYFFLLLGLISFESQTFDHRLNAEIMTNNGYKLGAE